MDFLRFVFSRRFLKHFLLATGITLVLIWIALKSLSWYTKHSERIIIPDFRGQSLQEVVADMNHKDYRFSVIDSVFDPDKPGGSILTQDPLPGSTVKKSRMVYLTVTSVVPEKTTMPELRDLTLRQAQTMLESAGLKTGRLIYIKTFDEDAVQNQLYKGKYIRAGTEIDKGSVISLMVGMGSKAAEMPADSTMGDSLY